MICKLKTLVLAMAAVLAIGAVSASAASAQQGFGTSEAPVTLTGTEAGGLNAITAFGQTFKCPGSTFTGHKVGTKEFLAMVYTTVTITPTFKTCEVGGVPATIHMNGCDYQTFLKSTNPAGNKEHTYSMEFSIVCPADKEITVTMYLNPVNHTADKNMCILHIPPQFGLTGAHIKSTTNGFFDITGTVKNIKIKKTGTSIVCPEEEETNTGELHLDIKVGGHNMAGTGIPVAITD